MVFSYYSEKFVKVGESLLQSRAFQLLSADARCLYIIMALLSGGRREFYFTESDAAKYGFNWETATALIDELRSAEFIHDKKHINGYRFCDEWKNG